MCTLWGDKTWQNSTYGRNWLFPSRRPDGSKRGVNMTVMLYHEKGSVSLYIFSPFLWWTHTENMSVNGLTRTLSRLSVCRPVWPAGRSVCLPFRSFCPSGERWIFYLFIYGGKKPDHSRKKYVYVKKITNCILCIYTCMVFTGAA